MKKTVINTVGTRKKSVARAVLKDGKGMIRVNSVPLEKINPEFLRLKIKEPLLIAEGSYSKYDINVSVFGGGVVSQAEAVRLAIAKALAENDSKLKDEFLKYDRTLLVADVRQRESRKPNRLGSARSKRQKSYR